MPTIPVWGDNGTGAGCRRYWCGVTTASVQIGMTNILKKSKFEEQNNLKIVNIFGKVLRAPSVGHKNPTDTKGVYRLLKVGMFIIFVHVPMLYSNLRMGNIFSHFSDDVSPLNQPF